MRNNFLIAALAFTGTAQVAQAQTTAESITQINERIAVSKAHQQQLELDVKTLSKQMELLKLQQDMEAMRGGDSRLPWLKGIEGIGGELVATLVMPDGQVIDAKPGAVLPNKMRVSIVRPNGVSLVIGKNARADLVVRSSAPVSSSATTFLPPASSNSGMAPPPGWPGLIPGFGGTAGSTAARGTGAASGSR